MMMKSMQMKNQNYIILRILRRDDIHPCSIIKISTQKKSSSKKQLTRKLLSSRNQLLRNSTPVKPALPKPNTMKPTQKTPYRQKYSNFISISLSLVISEYVFWKVFERNRRVIKIINDDKIRSLGVRLVWVSTKMPYTTNCEVGILPYWFVLQ